MALPGVVADPALDETTLATVMTAERHAVVEARAVVDTALEVAGGAGSTGAHRWSGPAATYAAARSSR